MNVLSNSCNAAIIGDCNMGLLAWFPILSKIFDFDHDYTFK